MKASSTKSCTLIKEARPNFEWVSYLGPRLQHRVRIVFRKRLHNLFRVWSDVRKELFAKSGMQEHLLDPVGSLINAASHSCQLGSVWHPEPTSSKTLATSLDLNVIHRVLAFAPGSGKACRKLWLVWGRVWTETNVPVYPKYLMVAVCKPSSKAS